MKQGIIADCKNRFFRRETVCAKGVSMQIIRGLKPGLLENSAITIGNFDGVHLGHQALLRHLKQEASTRSVPTVLVTFQPSAKQFFSKEPHSTRISSFSDKIIQLCHNDVDYVVCIRFNKRFSQTSAVAFLQSLKASLNPEFILIGKDFRFGYQRLGDRALMQKYFGASCAIEAFDEVRHKGLRISSTAIRAALQQQELEKVKEALGRPYSMTGRVCYGRQLGRTIGVPTANIALTERTMPLTGVFCVTLSVLEYQSSYVGVANIGVRPTVDGFNQYCEVHLLNFSGDLYGKRVQVEVLKKLRDEKKFDGLDALVQQINKDVQTANNFFKITI
jgi:riboflavin kinase/FMN adenylyltransferase